MNPLVLAGSVTWSAASWLARTGARQGILRSSRLDARVISVGNLQAGGSGKTPLVAQIAREAIGRGLRVCILSRGYEGEWEHSGGCLEPGTAPADPGTAGDEPALLHDLVPEAWIAVGSNRVASFEAAKARHGKPFDLVVLDDGFQHWKIKKDVEILALTSETFGNRFFRDWPWLAREADLLVWTKGSRQPRDFGKPIVRVSMRVHASTGQPIWMVSGVGDPGAVARSAREAGLEIRREIPLPDHARYERRSVDRWITDAAKENCRIALTGKDWVKWRALGVDPSQVLVLEPEIVFENQREAWEKVLWH